MPNEFAARELYLDLLKKCLTRYLFEDTLRPYVRYDRSGHRVTRRIKGPLVNEFLRRFKLELYVRVPFDRAARETGRDWPVEAETMIGLRRLENIQMCIRTILEDNIEGDFIETGVWRGGSTIFMCAVLKAYGDARKVVWCADSFRGLPEPDAKKYPADRIATWHTNAELAVTLDEVQNNFRRYGMLSDRVRFLEGWFKDTLPAAPIDRLSLIRLDGDMYESTMDALNNLYHKLSAGGFVIIDDYGLPEDTCRRAIHDFREARGVTEPIMDIDGWGAYWRKT
jgi:O-methyltransferase